MVESMARVRHIRVTPQKARRVVDLIRGKQAAAYSGASPHADIVVLRFPDLAAANGWFSSEAYQSLIPLRQEAAEVVLLCYEA